MTVVSVTDSLCLYVFPSREGSPSLWRRHTKSEVSQSGEDGGEVPSPVPTERDSSVKYYWSDLKSKCDFKGIG